MRTLGLFLALLCLTVSNAADSPSVVVEIFRHGIRTPEATQFDSRWVDTGYGELTSLGMRQQYILGAALAETYHDLLVPYNPYKINIQTTQENRTIVSALSQLYGIYDTLGPELPDNFDVTLAVPPYSDESKVEEILAKLKNTTAAVPGNYYPIPVHNVQKSADILMESYLNCPNANKFFYSQKNDSTVAEVFAELNETLQAVKGLNLSAEVSDYSDLDDLGDTVMADYPNQVGLPGGIDPTSQLYKDLVFWTQWYEIYPTLALSTQRQWFSGPFLYNTLDLFKQAQNGSTTFNFIFFAAKETMLATLLSAFNIMTPECLRENWENQKANKTIPHPQCKYPTFASNLIFEYYNTTNPYVIVKYNGEIVNLCDGQESCSIDDFASLVQTVTNGTNLATFNTNCGSKATTSLDSVNSPDPENLPSGLNTLDYVLFAIIVFLAVSLVVVIGRTKKHAEHDEYYKNVEVEA